MKALSENQARACEFATGKKCVCRCGGNLHGAGRFPGAGTRIEFEQLPPADPHKLPAVPHKVAWRGRRRGVRSTLRGVASYIRREYRKAKRAQDVPEAWALWASGHVVDHIRSDTAFCLACGQYPELFSEWSYRMQETLLGKERI